jgi:segregation and condensation protein A
MEKPIQLENFTGPLDLLLQLIEEKELEITEISIASVAEQFLSYLSELEERRPDELADFLVIATKLLLLKSHALLPFLHVEEEEDPGELAAQLRMYKKYADATKLIEAQILRGAFLYPKKATPPQPGFFPPQGLVSTQLHDYFVEVLQRLEPVVRIPKAALAKVVTLREKFCQIQDLLEKEAKLHFNELLSASRDRAEVVVTFLALLELVKQQTVCVTQQKSFSDITIEKM